MNQPDSDTFRLQRALAAIKTLRTRVEQLERARTQPVAIIGLGCRFPAAPNPAAYWRLLLEGGDAVREVPQDRWDVDALYDPDPQAPGKMYSRLGGFIDDIDAFDAQFFGISPREAARLDPQQRLLLEVSWEALEHAALNPQKLEGSQTGVFIGISEGEYLQYTRQQGGQHVDMHDVTGTASSVASGRLSYLLGLHGPNLAVDTACSSSLVAVHLATTSLRDGECDLALAGGVNILLTPDVSIAFCRAQALASDGHCKTFDAAADGYTRGEGCGMVVLKRLSDALADGDNILAVIRGSAVNQDGRTNGLTAPNGLSQQAVIRRALEDGGAKPSEVGYVETHGTGTQLGDPIEVNALGAVFRERESPLILGAVKTNVGHLEAAAGIAGLIKAVLLLQHGEIPPNLHFREPNPHIPWDELPVKVPTERMLWPSDRRVAGVSSFGFSGTNAHVLLEQAPERQVQTTDVERPEHVLTLSAKTEEALKELAGRYLETLTENPPASLGNVCFTANTGRPEFQHRLSVVAATTSECRERLAAFVAGKSSPFVSAGRVAEKPRVAFLFTGQGSQYVGMGRQLYATHPGFRHTMERCNEILLGGGYLPKPLLAALYPDPGSPDDASLINTTIYAQPALFALEYAVYELWESWGIKPDVLLGHSTGEYVAACVAGVFSLEDGLRLIAERARLIQSASSGGATAAVFAGVDQVAEALAPFAESVSVSGVNGPRETLIAGLASDVEEALGVLKKKGMDSRNLKIPHAPHSPLIDPVLDEFEAFARRVTYSAARIKLISNVTGGLIDAPDAAYWRRHMREPVRFMDGMTAVAAESCNVMLEVGPLPVLQLLGRQNWRGTKVQWLSSLWAIREDWKQMLQSIGELYVHGAEINWSEFERGYARRKVVLPTYPFQRMRHWLKKEAAPMSKQTSSVQGTRRALLLHDLKERMAAQLELDPRHIEANVTFVELGADSLLLAKLVQDVQDIYGVSLSIGQLFEELDTFETLSVQLDRLLPAGWSPTAVTEEDRLDIAQADSPARLHDSPPRRPAIPAASASAPADRSDPPGHVDSLTQILSYQLDIIARQLDILAHPAQPQTTPRQQFREAVAASTVIPSSASKSAEAASSARKLTPEHRRHLETLIARYGKRTAASRQRARTHRAQRADTRMRMVRAETKELAYPIVGARADGAHFWDIDGNEYVDIAMGVGVLLCGHYPPFIARAVSEQLECTIQTGPISELADEVAALMCEMTGMERAFFAVTGTCAVRGALRLAQAATGRSKFVMFSGSYHGQDDRTLAIPDVHGDPLRSVPMSPGVSPRAVDDVIILPYDNPKSLETIEAHAHELAAVLVEPVQSRNPSVQPGAFLRDLRRVTADLGVPLIFDEIITGFRVHPGGAQAWFGVEADIAVYGKCIGGGMPISVVAGKAAYLDRVDGGQWINEEGSAAQPETTYIGSTFEMHPLAMAATRAMLRHLKKEGPTLQQRLNERTKYLADALNVIFKNEQVPIRVLHFASLFRFAWKGNASYAYQPLEMEVFHLHLIEKGIYLWEGRTCFLSTAHSVADIERIIEAVGETVAEMRAGGFLPTASKPASFESAREGEQSSGLRGHRKSPLSEEQHALWSLEHRGGADSPSWCVGESLLLRGTFRLAAWRYAVQTIVDRHEALRTIFSEDGDTQEILPALKVDTELIDLTHLAGVARDEAVTDWLKREMSRPFDLQRAPLIRTYVFKLAEDLHQFALLTHHIVTDGWSIGILLEELAAVYSAECRGVAIALEPPRPYRDFARRQAEQRGTEAMAAHEAYWLGQFSERPPASMLPTDRPRAARLNHHGDRYSTRLDAAVCRALKQVGRAHGCTLFMTLLGSLRPFATPPHGSARNRHRHADFGSVLQGKRKNGGLLHPLPPDSQSLE